MPMATLVLSGPRRRVRDVAVAGLTAGVVSGIPSTTWAVLAGHDVLAATRAAGTLVPGRRGGGGVLPGLAAHTVIAAFWTVVLAALLPRRGGAVGVATGACAGVAIAAVDLGLVARRHPAVRSLPQLPQWADHVAFGAVAGALLGRTGGERGP